jgi:Poly A polymerase head domain
MDERIRSVVAGQEAYVVGGAVRDQLLGRAVLDVDVACREPKSAARDFARVSGGSPFLLSARHGAWRVALDDGRTVDFTLLEGAIEDDLAGRDFTINAIAIRLEGGNEIDPFGGRRDIAGRRLRTVTDDTFRDDPLRLLRAARLEDELAMRLDPASEVLVRRDAALVTDPAGERILAELLRLSRTGYLRLDELGLLAPLGGATERIRQIGPEASPELLLVCALGHDVVRLPISNETRRFARILLSAEPPVDESPRAIHRFRRKTEPWAIETLRFLGVTEFEGAVSASRAEEPAEPLLRGDELGVAPGPEVGRLLELIAEERAAGTIRMREEALELAQRERR